MSTFLEVEQLWVVDEDDANRLLKIGWKFLQAVIGTSGRIDSSFLGSGGGGRISSHTLIVMGRPKGVPERLKEDWRPYTYFERLEKQSNSKDETQKPETLDRKSEFPYCPHQEQGDVGPAGSDRKAQDTSALNSDNKIKEEQP